MYFKVSNEQVSLILRFVKYLDPDFTKKNLNSITQDISMF